MNEDLTSELNVHALIKPKHMEPHKNSKPGTITYAPVKTNEKIVHPACEYVDQDGKYVQQIGKWGGHSLIQRRADKALAIQKCVTDEYVREAMEDIRKSALEAKDMKAKASLWALYLGYAVGKPHKEVTITKNEMKVNATVDLSKLTDDELRHLDALMKKSVLENHA